MTTELAVKESMKTVADIRQQTLASMHQAMESADTFSRDLALAFGLQALRKAFTPEVVGVIAGLGGTPLGWQHDKNREGSGYSPDVIRDCAIEALLRGVSLTGNQFNIMSGRCYITREGYTALLAGYPGLTDLDVQIGLPEDARAFGKQEMVFVSAFARCKVNGKQVSVEARKTPGFDGRLAVKVYQGEIDAAKGKADRRIKQRLYERITGSSFSEPDDGVAIAAEVIEAVAVDPVAITQQPAAVGHWESERRRIEAPRLHGAWEKLQQAKTVSEIDDICSHLKRVDATEKDKDIVRRFAEHRLQEIGQ